MSFDPPCAIFLFSLFHTEGTERNSSKLLPRPRKWAKFANARQNLRVIFPKTSSPKFVYLLIVLCLVVPYELYELYDWKTFRNFIMWWNSTFLLERTSYIGLQAQNSTTAIVSCCYSLCTVYSVQHNMVGPRWSTSIGYSRWPRIATSSANFMELYNWHDGTEHTVVLQWRRSANIFALTRAMNKGKIDLNYERFLSYS